MPRIAAIITGAVSIALAAAPLAHAVALFQHPDELERVLLDGLCVTNGVISTLPDGRLATNTPSSRAVVRNIGAQSAAIRFRYLGPSLSLKPLASGELRRQIGIKLEADDTCNVLYIMWHIEPESRIAVSAKRNPDQHTHGQCAANGYVNIKPSLSTRPATVLPGDSHTLRADLQRGELTVSVDGAVAWQGTVGALLDGLAGPVGLRTDNARFEFDYFAGAVRGPDSRPREPSTQGRCQKSPSD